MMNLSFWIACQQVCLHKSKDKNSNWELHQKGQGLIDQESNRGLLFIKAKEPLAAYNEEEARMLIDYNKC